MKKFLVISFLSVGVLGFIQAQEDLPDEQVEVIKNFDARLGDAEMLKFQPELPPPDTATKIQTYTIPARSIQVDYLPPKIRPLAMRGEKEEEIYNGYLKAGVGIPSSFYGEAGYTYFRNNQFDFGVHARHHSANYKKVENQRFSNNFLKADGTYYFDQGFALKANAGYSWDNLYYYGYNFDEVVEDTSFLKEDVKQQFSTLDLGVDLFNGEQTSGDINYSAGADFYYLTDNYAAREHGFDLNLALTKWFNEKHPLAVKLRTDFNQFRDSLTRNLNNFYLQPNFTYHSDYFRVKVGINLTSHEDEYSIFPDVEATVPLIGSRLNVYIGAFGTLQKNTLRTLSDYNPFVATRANLMPENTRYFDYFGGLKGSYSGFEYNVKAGYRQAENLALFVPNYERIRESLIPYDFRVIYDDADIFYIKGNIIAPLTQGLSIIGDVSSNVYTMENEESAWHLPAFTLQGTIRYATLENRIIVKASAFVENGVTYPTEEGEKERLNGLFDISVGGEYKFLENFGVFLDIYNLANNKRRRWYNYPTYGLNLLVGVTARF